MQQPKDKTYSCEQLSSSQLLAIMHSLELDKTSFRAKTKDIEQLLSIFKMHHTCSKTRQNVELQPHEG